MTTTRALCATLLPTEGDLWFSTNPADRDRAKRYCATCPLLYGCADAGLARPDTRGVWGGLDTRDRNRYRGLPTDGPHPDEDPDGALPRRPLDCGTEAAWRSHLVRRESCTVCEVEHDARVRAERLRQLDVEHGRPAGGSSAGYTLHRRLGETPCISCHNEAMKDRAARKRAQRERAAGPPPARAAA